MKKLTSILLISLLVLTSSLSFAGEKDIPDIFLLSNPDQNVMIAE